MEYDIYDFHEKLKSVLVNNCNIRNISNEFMKLTKNSDKVKFSIKLIEENNLTTTELNYPIFMNKNDEKAIEFRKKGNELFSLKNSNYLGALEFYNKSLCFAKNNSENLGIGYANRSAIYYEWKEYEKCLENIQLARINNYPARLTEKLDKREKSCLEKISEKINKINISATENSYKKLSYDVHEKVPFISNCLELNENRNFGRFITTTRDLKPGDLIAIEKPFCRFLIASYSYKRCSYCLKENKYSLIPCNVCTEIMFCNQECYEKGLRKFHRLECGSIKILHLLFNKIHLNALRVVTYLFSEPENLSDIKNFVDKIKTENDEFEINAFTVDYKKNDLLEKYKPIHTLCTNQCKRNNPDLFQRSTIAAMIFIFLRENPLLIEIFKIKEYEDLFLELLFRHLQTAPTNMHSLSLIEDMKSTDLTFASGAYAFCSMINHSCAPNIFRLNFGSSMAIFVMRPIKKGGQLFDNYGFHHCLLERKERQEQLAQYNFVCQCEACEKDYPLFHDLNTPLEVPTIITQDETNSLFNHNIIQGDEKIQNYCKFLLKYDNYYPCYQLSEVQETLKISLDILVGNVPFKNSKLCVCKN